MEEAFLPEEILVLILTFLPVKSLIRFACVCKRFRFIILSDPTFAKSQLKAASDLKTLTHRLLFSSSGHESESLDLDTSLFGDKSSSSSSVRKLSFPNGGEKVSIFLMDSINGIVFLAFNRRTFYMWNPTIGFFKRLPDLVGLSRHSYSDLDLAYGVGYLPATDDYKLFIYSTNPKYLGCENIAALFSTRNNAWKRLHGCRVSEVELPGTFFKEALHWVDEDDDDGIIVALDLGDNEEGKLRGMSPPNDDGGGVGGGILVTSFSRVGVSPGGCLSLVRFSGFTHHDCIDVWVMREYNVSDSWNKILNLKLSNGPERKFYWDSEVLVMETIMAAKLSNDDRAWVIKINHIDQRQWQNDMLQMLEFRNWLRAIQYEETLIRIDD